MRHTAVCTDSMIVGWAQLTPFEWLCVCGATRAGSCCLALLLAAVQHLINCMQVAE